MCGVAGVLKRDGSPADPVVVQAMTAALAHRGPDGEGVHVEGHVGLGHRRLAILDLSDAAKQPLSCVEGRYWVTFNGEIFNFLELRHDLESHGYRFRTESDTEVIAAAYDFWGPDCVLRFNGMWAFAIWDSSRQELFLSRDHFGIKPLFFHLSPDLFAFASELKAFLFLDGFRARENSEMMSVALFDAGKFEMLDETLLEGVRQLRAGHNMLVTRADSRVWRWWRTLDHIPSVPSTFKAQAEMFRELFFDTCRLRLRSDVPVATCLSGGVDSSAVLCTLTALGDELVRRGDARISPDYQRAFVATFPGTPKDEQRYAKLAIDHSGATPRFRAMEPIAALESLRQYVYDFENVSFSPLIPLWSIYRELRRDGVVVSLDGHGGDELFAGYRHYVEDELRRTSLVRSPARTWRLVDVLQGLQGGRGPARARMFLSQAQWVAPVDHMATWWKSRHKRASLGGGLGESWAGSVLPAYHDLPIDEAEERDIGLLEPLNAALYRAVHQNHLPNILRNFDRCSMAHGVEIRMPFMDWRLVCYAFALPGSSKLGEGFTKRIVREAMRGVMPEQLRTRRDKIGFTPPLLDWFKNGLGDFVAAQVQTPEFLEAETWNGPAIRSFVAARHRANRWEPGDCMRVWPFVQAHLWREIFLSGSRSASPVVEVASGR